MSVSEDTTTLETLKYQRSAAKGKLTRIVIFMQNVDVDQRQSIHEIKARQKELELILQRFDQVQLQIEMVDDGPDRQSVHEQERCSFEEKYYRVKARMDSIITPHTPASAPTSPLAPADRFSCTALHYDGEGRKPRVKLPQLELPKFDGDIRQWPTFKNIFYASVDSTDLPVVNKLQYLKSALTGEAAGLISSLLITEENYKNALDILSKRYDNKTIIVNFHLKAIVNFNSVNRSNLKEFLVTLQQSLDSLKAIQLPVDSWDALLVFIITQKLDNSLRAAWEINRKENSIASLSELLDFLNQRRTAFELLYDSKPNEKIQNVKVSHVTSTSTKYDVTCILCQSKHALHKCPTYLELSTHNRLELIRSKSLCYNCLQPFRFGHKCSKYNCLKCKGKHHTTIHEDRPQQQQVSHNTTTSHSQQALTTTSHSQQAPIPTSHSQQALIPILPTLATATSQPSILATATPPSILATATPSSIPATATASMQSLQGYIQPTMNENHSQSLSNAASTAPSTVLMSNTNRYQMLLSTAVIRIQQASGKWINARALLDTGSEVNIVTHRLAALLELKTNNNACLILGVGNTQEHSQVSISTNIASRYNTYQSKQTFYVMDSISVPLPHTYIPTHTWHIPDQQAQTLADPSFFIPGSIDLLLNADVFYATLLTGRIQLGAYLPFLIQTIFGWVVSGSFVSDAHQPTPKCTMLVSKLTTPASTDDLLQSFWEQEEMTSGKLLSPEDNYCEELYQATTTQNNTGRYTVNLPLQIDKINNLGNSFNTAYRCLLQLESKMQKDTNLYIQYKAFIHEFIQLGHAHYIEDFSPTDTHAYYMPHLAVIKPDSATTKLRTVFNASAKTSTGTSLNDILYEGPNIYNDLFEIILRFRLYRYAFSCDIVKMFRAININPKQTYLQRVLWRDSKSEPLKCLEIDTVCYGTKCAPYLACRTMLHLADTHTDSHKLAADCIKSSGYMDDYLFGAQSLKQCINICTELIDLLSKAGFQLHKWSSNHTDILSHIAGASQSNLHPNTQCTQDTYNFTLPTSVKTLGLQWLPTQDTLQVNIPEPSNAPCTKRNILSQIAQIFDPIGILAPTTILAKILMQEIWKQNIDWDSLVPKDSFINWHKFIQQLPSLKDIHIPRYYFTDIPDQIVLLGFCDASHKAYGACLYLRATYPNKQTSCTLVTAKSKVTPIKKQQSIPRLELCGSLLLAQLAHRFIDSTKNKINICQMYLFTDSLIVLHWIKAPYKHKLDTYVTHRLMKVIELTKGEDWYYINTKQNPADLITRGVMPNDLPTCNLWWQGPAWLTQHHTHWPLATHQVLDEDIIDDKLSCSPTPHKVVNIHTDTPLNYSFFFDHFKKHSNFSKLVRTVSYILRFVHNLLHKNLKHTSHLTVSELKQAHNFVIQTIQYNAFSKEIQELQSNNSHTHTGSNMDHSKILHTQKSYTFTSSPLKKLNPFLDEDNILRVGGRIQHSDIPYNQAHPIILPAKNHITQLLIQHYHVKLLHSGIQNTLYNIRLKYWPINGRGEVKKCIYSCVRCTRYRGKVCGQQMADLPAPRVTLTRSFNHVGIDFSGAIAIRSSMTRNCRYSKGYICLFVCLATRAIHLELVTDLSSQAFICALKRFISRRGIPNCLYTDNATNFRGSKTELHDLYKMFKNETNYSQIIDLCSANYIEYKFTCPLASHMGGIYEAGIKSVKSLLKKHLFSTKLTYELLYTVLVQIEGILNSRPLYPITDLPNDLTCLTPAHFIIGTALTDIPEPSLLDVKESRLNVYQKIIKIKQGFWKQFYFSYLSELQTRNKWQQVQDNLNIGDLVIIKDEACPPTSWALGRIISINVNKNDGLARSVRLRTSKGEYTRPVNKLILLPSKDLEINV